VLSAAVGVSEIVVIRVVRPVTLNLPLGSIRERDERRAEEPGAFVAIFIASAVVPGIQLRIRARLGEFVAGDIRQRLQSF